MRVAIFNRGEVAVRVIRACQELGHRSLLLHSTPDKNTLAYRMADETFELEGNTALETYLNIEKGVALALSARAEALHPGFGFLSENAEFAEKITENGMIFVGPFAKSIRTVGNKVRAKELATKAGVPVLPAYAGEAEDPRVILKEMKKIGYPCIVKAAQGGGGKGMKVVRHENELFEMISSAQREAKAAFGSSQIFIEKYLECPRHIEVQVFFDQHGTGIHFFERECSIQRRHQKIFEETPSSALTPTVRNDITQAALRIAEAANYTNAGTVEFLFDGKNFYFMELNCRLQVEHTVTEQVCGVDLVHLQFAVARGLHLPLPQEDVAQRGHALEVRIYAEDPQRDFLPSTGLIEKMILPHGPFRRFDFGFSEGDEMTPFYDPMIGKVITWAPTRPENIQRMLSTLRETVIFGVHTNIEFLKDVLESENFRTNNVSTAYLGEQYKNGFQLPELSPTQVEFARSLQNLTLEKKYPGRETLSYVSPWGEFK